MMCESKSIETMPKDREFLAMNKTMAWYSVCVPREPELWHPNTVVTLNGYTFIPIAWAELPDSETKTSTENQFTFCDVELRFLLTLAFRAGVNYENPPDYGIWNNCEMTVDNFIMGLKENFN